MTPQEILESMETVTVYVHRDARKLSTARNHVKSLKSNGIKIKWFDGNHPKDEPSCYLRMFRQMVSETEVGYVISFRQTGSGDNYTNEDFKIDEFLKDMLPIRYAKKNIKLIESL